MARASEALGASPDSLSEEQRRKTLAMALEIATLRSEPPGRLDPVIRSALVAAGTFGFPNFPMPPLPSELQTRGRLIHDDLHAMVLNAHPQLLLYQLTIDKLLRENQEANVPLEVVTLLNNISQHLTGKLRFIVLEGYIATKEQQVRQLRGLSIRKPVAHIKLIETLVSAALHERSAHKVDCACLLCAHIKGTNSSALSASLRLLQGGEKSQTKADPQRARETTLETSGTARPASTASQKQKRRTRFFEAISTASNQKETQQQHRAAIQPKPEASTSVKPPQSCSSSAAAASSVSSPFSKEDEDRHIGFYQDTVLHPEAQAGPFPEETDTLLSCAHAVRHLSPSQLPPELAAEQRNMPAIRKSIKQLEQTPMDQLSSQLQDLKLRLVKIKAEQPVDPLDPRILERRINEALEEAGEPGGFKIPMVSYMDYTQDPPKPVYPEDRLDPKETERVYIARLEDLKKRKPRLHIMIAHWLDEHEAQCDERDRVLASGVSL